MRNHHFYAMGFGFAASAALYFVVRFALWALNPAS